MKNLSTCLIMAQAVFAALVLNSCNRYESNESVIPGKTGSARVADGPRTNWMDCDPGYHYDNSVHNCVLDTDPNDINPSTINFNESQANTIQYNQSPTYSVRLTPGTDNGGKVYYRGEMFSQGNAVAGEVIIFTLFDNSTKVEYFASDGQSIGVMTVAQTGNGATFNGWNSRGIKGFPKQWAKCIGTVAGQMANGTLLGSVALLGCTAFGAECAVAMGLGCAVSAYANNY